MENKPKGAYIPTTSVGTYAPPVGAVAEAWVGKLEPSQEEDVLRILKKN
jgi:hypothetical protein